ncbi:MAG: carbohydrate ABC transporter permease [Terrimicrobiaceae bacterium]|jgi:multiple sugar transport system permease protein
MTRTDRTNLKLGLTFISPWILGFLALFVYPLVSSIYFSLCDYSVLSPAVFIGAQNYVDLIHDEVFWTALYNTFFFAAFALPLGLFVSLSLALLLNFEAMGRGIFRTIFFLPSLVPMVCLAVLWQWMLNGELGLINNSLNPALDFLNSLLGTNWRAPNWLAEARYAKWGIIFTVLWGVGNAVVIFLAGLQDVPRHLYESAEIDGANFWQKTLHITLPILSPVIYFNLIMGLIGSFQVFAVPYVMMNGGDGPGRSLLFLATYLYQNAFDYWNMGYACAIGVILFGVILLLTYVSSKISERHVYYAGK